MEISADAWSQIPSWMPARKVISRDEDERKNNANELINRRSNLGIEGEDGPVAGRF